MSTGQEIDFHGGPAEPSAFLVEAGYSFDTGGRPSRVAIGYENTDEAGGLSGAPGPDENTTLNLPEDAYYIDYSIGLLRNTALKFQLRNDEDYDPFPYAAQQQQNDGGTGNDRTTFVT